MVPKATMHFHRDLMIIADGYAREILQVTPDDIFVGSPPLAFTFGLGGLAIFPLRFRAAATLLEQATPPNMVAIIETYRATVSFTAPTAYRAMLKAMDEGADLSSLRVAVSAGETLPAPSSKNGRERPASRYLDGIGATGDVAHLHLQPLRRQQAGFDRQAGGRLRSAHRRRRDARVAARRDEQAGGARADRLPLPQPAIARRTTSAAAGTPTGDTFVQDEDGFFHFAARSDDMIVSAGYNIAGPEVEAALLSHTDVAECAVIGVEDAERGQIVEAHVVLVPGTAADAMTAKRLQDHVKATIAPYKYPRSVKFVAALPETQTGKISASVCAPKHH
ncbi:AMP-binding enzyme [Mesorhizobium atlanticum]